MCIRIVLISDDPPRNLQEAYDAAEGIEEQGIPETLITEIFAA